MVGWIGGSSPLAKGPHWTMVHGWISMSSAAKDLQTSHTDDMSEWLLVSA